MTGDVIGPEIQTLRAAAKGPIGAEKIGRIFCGGYREEQEKVEKNKEESYEGKALWRIGVFLLSLITAASFFFSACCGVGTYYVVNENLKDVRPETAWSRVLWYDKSNMEDIAANVLYAYLEIGYQGIKWYFGQDLGFWYVIYYKDKRIGGNLSKALEDLAKTFYFEEGTIPFFPKAANYSVKILMRNEYDGNGVSDTLGTEETLARFFKNNFPWIFWGLVYGVPLTMVLLAMDIGVINRRKKFRIGMVPIEIAAIGMWSTLHLMLSKGALDPPLLSALLQSWIARCASFIALTVFFAVYLISWLRNENYYKYSLLYWAIRGLGRLLKMYGSLFANRKLIWKLLVLGGTVILVELLAILIVYWRGRFVSKWLILLWVLEKLFLLPYLIYHGLILTHIQETAHEIASGNMDCQTKAVPIPGLLKDLAQDINAMSDSISIAVEDRMKSERLKTELITNVSHDIKTPLTSIINFADLIKKENSENPKIQVYADHLYQQSSRMKKLIEDLMEASKASTGNMEINLEICDVRVLLGQCLGEYEDRLKEHDLELVVKLCEESIYILADTKMLWRVFDNLMGNICKYAQGGTRVYLSTEVREKKVLITFKNISNYALDIPPEELMERFVRGDLSRHSEGNGLGLSIVKGLMDLQKGNITLAVDGDLFKAILEFPIADQKNNGAEPERDETEENGLKKEIDGNSEE